MEVLGYLSIDHFTFPGNCMLAEIAVEMMSVQQIVLKYYYH